MAKEVSFSIKIKEDGSIRQVTADAEELGRALRSVQDESEKAKNDILTWSEASQAFETLADAIESFHSIFSELTEDYQAAVLAQTKLQTIMKQRMGATDDEINSIRALCSEQQELGVVEDDIAASGAQQLATFLKNKQSLDVLIPAMNNLIAQQEGFNATAEGAISIGNMMGKAMQGQVEVLQRVGISFDEDQKKILQFGTESQRAAMLAQVITANVGNMNEALGQTDVGRLKQLKNALGDIMESVGSVLQGALPLLTISANIVMVTANAGKMLSAFRALRLTILNFRNSIITSVASTTIFRTVSMGLTATLRVLRAAFTGATIGATTLRVAIRGLLISTGVGVAIWALTEAINYLIDAFSGGGDAAHEMSEAEARAKADADALKQAKDNERQTMEQTRAALEINIQKLKTFHGTKEQEKAIVEEMNNTYGQTLGYFGSVSAWYHALVSDSKAYCDQMVAEARTRMLANQIAKKEQENYNIRYDETGHAKKYSKANGTYRMVRTGQQATNITDESGQQVYVDQYRKVSNHDSDLDKANRRLRQNNAVIANLKRQMEASARSAASVKYAVKGASTRPNGGTAATRKSGNATEAEKTRQQQLTDMINKAKEAYVTAGTEKRAAINKNINAWQKELDIINLLQSEAARPRELNSMQDIDREIAYQQTLRKTASKDKLAGIDQEIDRLNDLKTALEDGSHKAVGIDKITTYEQLDKEIDFYERKLKKATPTERTEIQKQINALNDLRQKWDDALAALRRPANIEQLDTIEQLDKALSYYQDRQKKAGEEERLDIQRTINALQAKKDAMTRSIELPAMQQEVDDLSLNSPQKLRMELEVIGIDGIKDKIRSLQKMLEDTKNPLSDKQRKQVNGLISSWSRYEKILKKSQVNFSDAWGGIKGIGGGIEGLTSALEGNGNAWQTLTGVVDSFMSIYDGFSKVIEIINALTAATTANTAATTAQGVAKTAEATIDTTATGVEVANSAARATASGIETTADVAGAAAKTMKAHSNIPWVGIAIGAGMVASLIGLMMSLPKFADGGIAYGPTLGIFGEYAGASHNPEVVAPLDKLKGLIGGEGGLAAGQLELKVKGRELVAVLANETRINRRKTNIKL